LSSQKALEELARGKETLYKKQSDLNRQLNEQTAKKAALEKERDLLVNQLTLLKKIESYEEARQQLEDGKACPLCGATAHPIAEGNIPVPDETSQRLETAKEELNAATDAVAELRVNLERVRNDLEHVATGQKEHAATIEKARPVVLHACEDLGLDASASDLDVKLKALQDENLKSYEHATEVVKAAEKHERTINTLRESLDAANTAVSNAERETQDAAHAKDSAEKSANLLKKEANGLRGTQEASHAALQKDVQGYGIDAMTLDNLDQVQSRLTTRRDQWMGRQQKKAELDRQIAALDMQTRHQAEHIQKSEDELNRQQKHHDDLLRDRKVLATERREIYGDRVPDKEEARLFAAIETADSELNTVREKLNQANQALSQLKTKIQELTESIAGRAAQLESSEEAFLARLKELGFPSEDRYKAACLPESERKALAQRSKALSDEKTKIESAWEKNTELLKDERKKQITNEQLDKLKSDLEALVAKQKALQQEIGIIRGKLEGNEDLRQQQQQRVLAIDAQKRECSRWDLLHELIGSADGKKFRNFAQGLTFEMMIGHANRQLQKMTDRYLLVRDDAQPLELNVIDNYQAGEIRSTKNLSGGESFIVSLALALGLSQMASKNVRVDSLFLDEGFGSLDEEALDTALETLGSLQHEGKLIGVISHVAAIKERIGTRIQVVPDTGGRSVISGPGCQLL
jgi:exonuclease SbcC